MKFRSTLSIAAAAMAFAAASPAQAQKTITEEYLDLIIRAITTEQQEVDGIAEKVAEIDAKIEAFNECREMYEAAGDVSGSRLGGLAARAAIRAKCGASNTDGFMKDRAKLLEGPQRAALSILGIKAAEYGRLREQLFGYLASGTGFSAAEISVLGRRRAELAGAMRIDLSALAAERSGSSRSTGGRSRSAGLRAGWTTDYAWEYIGHMFEIMYVSGATVFEKPYEPGQWTRWDVVSRETRYDDDDRPDSELESRRAIERAFLGRTEDGGEWWRTTSIDFYTDDTGAARADTVILESLFKGENEYIRQLVRVRAKLPGQEANELMVPQAFAMLSLLSVFPMKPTEESVRGATIGNERVGNHDARQVRFAAGGGTIEWWLADAAPGGWVRFRHTEAVEDDVKTAGTYTLQMTDSGTGAKSLLGVMQ